MIEAKVVADSLAPHGVRLTTLEVTMPRIILAEFNTHRMFSRNSASSRAIPVEKMLHKISVSPFMPCFWGKNQSGMQALEALGKEEQAAAKMVWTQARDDAVRHAQELLAIGAHKQIVNRLLEPFMWHTVVVTATEWANFFALRESSAPSGIDPKFGAQPEMQLVARAMKTALDASAPDPVPHNGWHLPYVEGEHRMHEHAMKISVARCARVSYLRQGDGIEHEADLRLYDMLSSNGHMSPFEHVATPSEHREEYFGNFRGWHQLRKLILHEDDYSKVRFKDV